MGMGLLLMVSLVIISTIDLDDWMPGSRAPGLFVFAPPEQQRKGVGTFFTLLHTIWADTHKSTIEFGGQIFELWKALVPKGGNGVCHFCVLHCKRDW